MHWFTIIRIKTKEDKYLKEFFIQVNWLVNAIDHITKDAIAYHFKFEDIEPPWYSGLDAALYLSVMGRAYEITHESKYLNMMVQSKNFLMLPIEEGGVLSKTDEGYFWVEEYVSDFYPHVLNGFQYVIISLTEYLRYFSSDRLTRHFQEKCLCSLKNLDKYEKYYWLLYDTYEEKYHFVSNNYMPMQAYKMLHLDHILMGGRNIIGNGCYTTMLALFAIFAYCQSNGKMQFLK